MRRKGTKIFLGTLAVVSLVVQMSLEVYAAGGNGTFAMGTVLATTGNTAQSADDEWASVEAESKADSTGIGETDEFGCRLKNWHTCYKYEYAYRTGDTSCLEGEKEVAFYEGLKGYLDYAYQFDTPYGQEKAIHDYMVLNTEFAVDGYIDGKYNRDSWDYDGIFVHGQAVCQGYALGFKLCMDILGIESRVIVGNARDGKHAWNAVQLDGEWYYVDVTWDDPIPDAEGKVSYNYFNVPEWWIAQEHEIKAPLEPVGTKYSGDEVLLLTVGSEEKALNKMLRSHWGDMSTKALYRVYIVKEDGTPWSREDISKYHPSLSFMNDMAYKSMGWLDIESGSAFCWYYQGRCGSPGKFVMMFLTVMLIFASPVIVILLIVLLVRKLRRKKKEKMSALETGNGDKT